MKLQGRELKINLSGEDVRLLHRELATLGLPIPDQERREGVFGEGTLKAVTRFQKERGMEPTGVVDAEMAGAINAAVDAATFTVEGKVASRFRAGVGGLRVEIVDKNVGMDVPLSEAMTDDSGAYRRTFTITDLRQRGKQRPDLQARAFVGETPLGASEVRYNASNRETLNVLLTEEAVSALASEYETLTSTLSAYFKGSLRDLKEKDDRQDITYLANKTGWDARAVAMAARADQFSAKTRENQGAEIEPTFFYALFRAGLPANENALYQTGVKTAETIWKQGIEQGVIPAALKDKIPQALERFQQLVAQRTLDGPALAGVSSLKEMLTVSGVNDPAEQQEFAALYTRHRGDLPQFWKEVQVQFGEATEKRLKLDGQLGHLTLNNGSADPKVAQRAWT